MDTTDIDRAERPEGAGIVASEVDVWFARNVLPLEAVLMQFLRRNWRDASEIADLRQDVYVRVYEAALKKLPDLAKPFVFATARNLLINRVRQKHIVPIEAVADLDSLGIANDEPAPDHSVMARDELAPFTDRPSTACLPRCSRKPSSRAGSTDCRGMKSPSAWASAKRLSLNISTTDCGHWLTCFMAKPSK